ncbi:putative ATP-binding protein involved in virulence [Azomonas agilis]|uniref:Putative ATP-binding protein involved in virulence n=1 Tax=Azomonas agilis TaxID=116849 RepID=A0A562HYN0_9GAMM|nr:AAA family ATPase [Azomonas agilis]TWH63897.1 putative ATP-binding protein involved in virulence [Azomonas agilis]
MKLDLLRLENFRCFTELELPLHKQMTVIVAENGQGKSTLLDAIRIALWPYISSFDLARNAFNDPGNTVAIDDVRLQRLSNGDMARQLPAKVIMTGDFGSGAGRSWGRYRDSEAKSSKTKDEGETASMRQWTASIQERIRNPESPALDLPVFGYYGTGRLWAQKRLMENLKGKDDTQETDFYIRTFAYLNCLDPASSYKHFKEWFIWAFQSLREQQIRQLEGRAQTTDLKTAEERVQVVQQAIDTFLYPITGWHRLEYSITREKSLVLTHEQLGTLDADQLSDGIRSVLAMIGDIAYRCIKLNPHLGVEAAKATKGVVLIDEVDMHLHPRWQQAILTQLQEAFPKIQFVVTTHSPQVLTTVPSECIRILRDNKVYSAPPGTEGAEPERMLKQVLGLNDVRPPTNKATQELREYLTLVDRDQWNSPRALELRQSLDARYQGQEPALLDADLQIENRKWELGE